MSETTTTPRAVLDEADRLRRIAERARELHQLMAVERNGSIEIGRKTLYQHQGFPADLVIIEAMRGALADLATEHDTQADALERTVVVEVSRG